MAGITSILPKSEGMRIALLNAMTAIVVAVITGVASYRAGERQGKGQAAAGLPGGEDRIERLNEIRSKDGQLKDKQGQIEGLQNQIVSLQRTVDFLMGKTGTLNELVEEYERRLGIPQQGRIVLFQHIDYRGHRCYLKPGEDVSDLRLYGFGNTVSSVKVVGNLRAKAYSGTDYDGTPLPIERDLPSLRDYGWNDVIQSIIVEK